MVTRNKYGIPQPSGPMELYGSHNDPTPGELAEAEAEAQGEAALFRAQEMEGDEMYQYT